MKKLLFVVLFLLVNFNLFFASQDTIHVITHNKVKIITDPSKGENPYPSWSVFPSKEIKYRKINLYVSFQCPDTQQCGEWDYLNYIYLKKSGSRNNPELNYELARLITPYGRNFNQAWKFTWKADVTDFALFLHDSVQIEYKHTGYEPNNDRGWKITVDFEIIAGTPVAEPISIQELWNGSYPYGDSTNDIEKHLSPKTFKTPENSEITRLRILQTGHGMDEQDGCAEFCSKYREIFFDNKLIEHRDIWMKCGSNPVFPQAGTWIFDRGNWCPGMMVEPESFTFVHEKNSTHTIDINMEPYKVTKGKPSANYVLSGYNIFYKKPNAAHDASIEEIIVPSAEDIHSRFNPVCFNPKIIIKNNGYENLTSLKIKFGMKGKKQEVSDWSGNLPFGKTETIELKGLLNYRTGKNIFEVSLLSPNGKTDDYPKDNILASLITAPSIYPPKFIFNYKTNNDTGETAYRIFDLNEKILFEKKFSELNPGAEYNDTISLGNGCYQLIFEDKGGNGLEFWYNRKGGMGYARLLGLDGRILKSFPSDFGNEILHSFKISDDKNANYSFEDEIIYVYPHRTSDKTILTLIFNEIRKKVNLQILSNDNKILKEYIYPDVKNNNYEISLGEFGEGIYQLKIIYGDKSKILKVKVAKR